MKCSCPKSEWRPGDRVLHGSYCEIGRKEEAAAIDSPLLVIKR